MNELIADQREDEMTNELQPSQEALGLAARAWTTPATASHVMDAGFRAVADVPAAGAWTPQEGINRRQTNIFGEELRPAEAKVRWERSL